MERGWGKGGRKEERALGKGKKRGDGEKERGDGMGKGGGKERAIILPPSSMKGHY